MLPRIPYRNCRRGSRQARFPSLWMLCATLILSSTAGGLAHVVEQAGTNAGAPQGLAIPSVTHGEMRILAHYHAPIIALAERQLATDGRFRRLLNHATLQYAYCLWGVVPGAVSDEDNAFNGCSHAYLASDLALLREMELMPAARSDAGALLQAIEKDRSVLQRDIICRLSAETFNTATLVSPAWAELACPELIRPVSFISLAIFGVVIARRVRARERKMIRDG